MRFTIHNIRLIMFQEKIEKFIMGKIAKKFLVTRNVTRYTIACLLQDIGFWG